MGNKAFIALALLLALSQLAYSAGACALITESCQSDGDCCSYGAFSLSCNRYSHRCELPGQNFCGLEDYACTIPAPGGQPYNGYGCCEGYVCEGLSCAGVPDLEVLIFNEDPTILQSQASATLEVAVMNSGGGATGAGFALSASSNGGASVQPQTQNMQALAGGREDYAEFTVTCPNVNVRTEYVITATADPNNAVSEYDENNNAMSITLVCAPVAQPDMSVAAYSLQPQTAHEGESVVLHATVQNSGIATPAGVQIPIAASVQNPQGQPPIAAQSASMGQLAQGGRSDVEFSFACPQVSEPSVYVARLSVDEGNRVAESNEGNNAISAPFTCMPAEQNGAPNAGLAGIAILLALSILALAYMASYVFDQPHLRGIIYDETVHLLAAAVVLLAIVSLTVALNNTYAPALLRAAGGGAGGETLGGQAMQMLNGIGNDLSSSFNGFREVNENLGKSASKSVYCTFFGAGYSLVACSTLNMLRGTTVQAMVALGGAISDISAEKLLLQLAQMYAFSLLLPIGLFLYAFKFTRAGGAALIAVAVGFYIVHPLTIVFFEAMLMPQVQSVGGQQWGGAANVDTQVSCDPFEQSLGQIEAERAQLASPQLMEHVIFLAIVRAVFATIVRLMITLAFIRAFASLLGSEIDVSALSRIS